MNIFIGTDRAIVGTKDENNPHAKTVYRDLGYGEHVVELRIPEGWTVDEQVVSVIAALQHHVHREGHVRWIECPDAVLRQQLQRHYVLANPSMARPSMWGEPKGVYRENEPPEDEDDVTDEAEAAKTEESK